MMRTLIQFDGQNLFHLAKNAWGPGSPYQYPSYDVVKLAEALVWMKTGRTVEEVRFYTGVPNRSARPTLNGFWENKLKHLESQGVEVYRGKGELRRSGKRCGRQHRLGLDPSYL